MYSMVVADAVSHEPSAELKVYLVDISRPTLAGQRFPPLLQTSGEMKDGS
jgi:hypothetical protein